MAAFHYTAIVSFQMAYMYSVIDTALNFTVLLHVRYDIYGMTRMCFNELARIEFI